MSEPKYYSLEDIAEMLQTTVSVLRAAIKAGRLRALKVGLTYRVSQSSLDAYLAAITKDIAQ